MASFKTKFKPQDNGFKFLNSFDFSSRVDGSIIRSTLKRSFFKFGLCGGMVFATLDFFYAGESVPNTTDVPDEGTPMFKYLLRRQIDSLTLNVLRKVFSWMFRTDRGVDRLSAGREFMKLCNRLNRGDPVPLVLIRVGRFEDPTYNHQVLAIGYDFAPRYRELSIDLYDPNRPRQEPKLTMNFRRPAQGINIRQSTGEPLRGFFVGDYKRKTPPDLY